MLEMPIKIIGNWNNSPERWRRANESSLSIEIR